MNFVEIVDTVDEVEAKLDSLSLEKIELVEAILTEGSEIEFDSIHHLDHLISFVDSYTDAQATTIVESVDCGKVLEIILDSVRKHASDADTIITEAVKNVGEMDVEMLEGESDRVSLPLLSVVTNVLTEMTSEETVEGMPVEMIFDIVNEAKELDLPDSFKDLSIEPLLQGISGLLKEAIKSGKIEFDTADYEEKTLSEFLADYENTGDLLEEMAKITGELLAESKNTDAARVLAKAKSATIMLEADRCAPGDIKCMEKKGKAAKAYFAKGGSMKGTGFSPKSIVNVTKIPGRLGKIVREIKKSNPRYPHVYIRNVVIPAIINKMAQKKGRKRKTDTDSMRERA